MDQAILVDIRVIGHHLRFGAGMAAAPAYTCNPLKEPLDRAFVVEVDNRVTGHKLRFLAHGGGTDPAVATVQQDFSIGGAHPVVGGRPMAR